MGSHLLPKRESSRLPDENTQKKKKKKESDEGSEGSGVTRTRSVHVGRTSSGRKDPQHNRWSHVKISFDNESVRLDPDPPPTSGGGGTTSILTGAGASATIAPPSATSSVTVAPTIKIIGKEVSVVAQVQEWLVKPF